MRFGSFSDLMEGLRGTKGEKLVSLQLLFLKVSQVDSVWKSSFRIVASFSERIPCSISLANKEPRNKISSH